MLAAARRVVLAPLALTLVAAACSRATTTPRGPVDEVLTSIQFEGNHQISDQALVTGLALHRTPQRRRAPDPYTIQLDADRVRGEYLRRGYLDVEVRHRVEREGDATTVIFTVEEGARARTRVEILGLPDDPKLPVSKVRRVLPLGEGEPFAYEPYANAKQALENVVEDAGYAHVKLESRVIADRARNLATIQLDYAPGPKSTFGATKITGVTGELRAAVEHRLAFEPGQPYSNVAILATQRKLYALGRFSSVRVSPELTGEPPDPIVAMTVDVAQSARHEVKLGGGFGVDPVGYEIRGRVGYSVAGWLLPLNSLTLDLRPAYGLLRDGNDYQPRIRALARVERQDLLWTYSRGELEGGYDYIAYRPYTSYGPRVQLGVSTPVWADRVELHVGWGIRRHDFDHIDPFIDEPLQRQLGLDHTERVGAYQQSVSVDLRDHPIETHYGAYAELRVSEGTRYAGSAYEYLQIVPEVRGFLPLRPRRTRWIPVLAARARVGGILGDLAPTERFFSGGASAHRGFAERNLAPGVIGEDRRWVPYGGGALVETSLEVRVPITTIWDLPLGGVVFLDGGDVTETPGAIELSNLHWAAGAGVRLMTPVGPARFDVGYRLNRTGGTNPAPDSRFAFHLSLGEAF